MKLLKYSGIGLSEIAKSCRLGRGHHRARWEIQCHLALLVFCLYSSKNGSKNTIFQKWLEIHPKVLNAKNKHGIHHFGGWLALQVISVFLFQRPKCHFLALENGHFWQKCPFSSAKKWHFERPHFKTESKNLAKHPPKWLGRHLGHAFPFSGEYQPNFWKSCF